MTQKELLSKLENSVYNNLNCYANPGYTPDYCIRTYNRRNITTALIFDYILDGNKIGIQILIKGIGEDKKRNIKNLINFFDQNHCSFIELIHRLKKQGYVFAYLHYDSNGSEFPFCSTARPLRSDLPYSL